MTEADRLRALLGQAEENLRGVLAMAIQHGALDASDAWVRDSQALLKVLEKEPQMFRPCPHPSRQPLGRHETYMFNNGGLVCRACGARSLAKEGA